MAVQIRTAKAPLCSRRPNSSRSGVVEQNIQATATAWHHEHPQNALWVPKRPGSELSEGLPLISRRPQKHQEVWRMRGQIVAMIAFSGRRRQL